MAEDNGKAPEEKKARNFKEGHRDRLRKRFLEQGAQSLTDRDLLELLLVGIISRKDVQQIANHLIDKFKTYPAIFDASIEELETVPGFGEGSAIMFKAIHETCERYLRQQIRIDRNAAFDTPEKIAEYARLKIGSRDSEALLVFYLNSKLHRLQDEIISFGDNSAVSIGLRTVAKNALKANAESVVLCHNHPSGVLRPSEDDDNATKVILQALSAVDIMLIDHLIVSGASYYSYREHMNDPGRPSGLLTPFPRR